MIGGFLKRVRAARLWTKAGNLSAEGKHEEALWLIRSADEEIRKKPRWQLREIHFLGLMNQHVGTEQQAKVFVAELSAKPDLTADERYFLAFAQWYGRVAFRKLHASQPEPDEFQTDLSKLPLAEVSPRWKETFPMPIHPEWDDSKPAAKQGLSR